MRKLNLLPLTVATAMAFAATHCGRSTSAHTDPKTLETVAPSDPTAVPTVTPALTPTPLPSVDPSVTPQPSVTSTPVTPPTTSPTTGPAPTPKVIPTRKVPLSPRPTALPIVAPMTTPPPAEPNRSLNRGTLFSGWNVQQHKFVGTCVELEPGSDIYYAGAQSAYYNLNTPLGYYEVAPQIENHVYGNHIIETHNSEAGNAFLDSITPIEFSRSLTYGVRLEMKDVRAQNRQLNSYGKQVLAEAKERRDALNYFRERCGDVFVNSLRPSASFFVNVSYKMGSPELGISLDFDKALEDKSFGNLKNTFEFLLKNLKNSGSLTLTGLQIGGNVERIQSIFPSTIGSGRNQFGILHCDLTNATGQEQCRNAFNKLHLALTDSKTGFSSDFSDSTGYDISQSKEYAATDFTMVSYSFFNETHALFNNVTVPDRYTDVTNRENSLKNDLRKVSRKITAAHMFSNISRLQNAERAAALQAIQTYQKSRNELNSQLAVCLNSSAEDCLAQPKIELPKPDPLEFLTKEALFADWCDHSAQLDNRHAQDFRNLIKRLGYNPDAQPSCLDIYNNLLDRHYLDLSLPVDGSAAESEKFTGLELLNHIPIEHLDISGNAIRDLSPTQSMPLISLNAHHNTIRTLPENWRADSLRFLNLSDNPLRNGVEFLNALPLDYISLLRTGMDPTVMEKINPRPQATLILTAKSYCERERSWGFEVDKTLSEKDKVVHTNLNDAPFYFSPHQHRRKTDSSPSSFDWMSCDAVWNAVKSLPLIELPIHWK